MYLSRIISIVLFLALSCSNQSVFAQAADPPGTAKYMMWHLSPIEGATPEHASMMEKRLRKYFKGEVGGLLLDEITMDSVVLVEGNEKFLRCGMGAVCLADLGKEASMDYVIAGEVGLSAGQTTIRMILVEVSRKSVVCRATVHNDGVIDRKQLKELTVAMFDHEAYRGSLEIQTTVEGAKVAVDGKDVGVTPLVGPLAGVAAGEHLVEVKKTGYTPFSLTVRVPYGNKVTVNAVLPPVIALIGPRPFYQDWPFYTAAGVGVAFIAAAGFLHHDAVVLAEDAQICADNDLVCEREKRSQSDSRYLQAYVLYGLGSAGLAAAGLIMILDLAASDDSSSTDETMAGVRFGPAPAGLGLTVNWRF